MATNLILWKKWFLSIAINVRHLVRFFFSNVPFLLSFSLALGLVCQQTLLLFADLCSAIRLPNLHIGRTMWSEPYWYQVKRWTEAVLWSSPRFTVGNKNSKNTQMSYSFFSGSRNTEAKADSERALMECREQRMAFELCWQICGLSNAEQTDVHSHESVKNIEVFEVEMQKSSEGGRPA